MIEVNKIYEVSYLYDIYYQLQTGNYPLEGFQTFDKVCVFKIENGYAYCSSKISRDKIVLIPIIYLIEDKSN